jgi:cytosine/adenosine deaminase-related metal-dependent hydrolase
MLTLHRATLLLPAPADLSAPPIADGAVVVQGDRIAGLGPYRELAAAFPAARTREWGGLLTPGLRNPYGHWLLECAYHPDPREEIGAEPLHGPELARLGLDEARWGGSARRGLQRMLGHGVTAVAGPFERPSVRTAVTRSGLLALPGDGARGPLDPLGAGAGLSLAEAAHGSLTTGGRADLTVLELDAAGNRTGGCLATVLAGRLLHRRR